MKKKLPMPIFLFVFLSHVLFAEDNSRIFINEEEQ